MLKRMGVLSCQVAILLYSLSGCQSIGISKEQRVADVSARFHHLEQYHEMKCSVSFAFAEPVRSAWGQRLKNESGVKSNRALNKLFAQLNQTQFVWRSTPYRCEFTVPGDPKFGEADVVFLDAAQKLNAVFCTWLQSFYADSPYRGWRNGAPEIQVEKDSVRLIKGEQKWVSYSDVQKRVTAVLGPGTELSSVYGSLGSNMYPQQINLLLNGRSSRIDSFVYEHHAGFEVLKSFWLQVPDAAGDLAAYLRADISDCNRR